ncbi:MAG: cytochrome c oxidase subunit 3 [Saprospiraceae bacterium]|nr:cytochrome c oxidase subunit 3 [Saprospiraceae bacterium]
MFRIVGSTGSSNNSEVALRFALWIGMGAIVMMFAALTSAYIVRKAAGNWYEFKLPVQFFYSTIAILISSYFTERACKAYKRSDRKGYLASALVVILLGGAFIVSQLLGWRSLTSSGVTLDLNVSGSFLYALSGLHLVHVLGGMAVFCAGWLVVSDSRFRFTQKGWVRLDLARQYWHFIGLLWIYLLVFLILQ